MLDTPVGCRGETQALTLTVSMELEADASIATETETEQSDAAAAAAAAPWPPALPASCVSCWPPRPGAGNLQGSAVQPDDWSTGPHSPTPSPSTAGGSSWSHPASPHPWGGPLWHRPLAVEHPPPHMGLHSSRCCFRLYTTAKQEHVCCALFRLATSGHAGRPGGTAATSG